MKKAIIFDMDGVLIDSEPMYREQFREFFQMHNKVASKELLDGTAGASQTTLWELVREGWQEDVTAEQMRDLFHETFRGRKVNYNDIIFPGTKKTIETLSKKFVLAIASSSSLKSIQAMLEETGMKEFFTLVVTGRQFRESKPHPEIYLHTVEKLGFSKDECLIVEDSTYGVQAGNRAGVDVVAIRDTRFGFEQDTANYFVDAIEELPELPILQSEN